MSDKRTVTISVTINLGNYENLRLEVSDTAETTEEAGELRRFLAGVLDGFASNNATAKAAVEKYRERILDEAAEEVPEPVEEERAPEDMMFSFPEETHTEPVSISEPLPEPTPEPLPVQEAEPEPLRVPEPAPAPAAAAEEQPEFFCEKCGIPVTKLQHDVSKLFYRKILCKDCIKSVNQ